jgi:hypothetical protein
MTKIGTWVIVSATALALAGGCGGGASDATGGSGGSRVRTGGTTGAGTGGAGAVTGQGGSGAGGSGGALGGSGGGGASGGSGGGGTTGGLFDDLVDSSSGMTVAVDASGAIHVAASTDVQGTYSVVYGRCAAQCGQAASWSFVTLPFESSVSKTPTIALTADGRPRIAYASDFAAPGYHYLECATACTQAASWSDVRLTTGAPTPDPAPRPHLPFAVSQDGAAAFAYDDGSAMYAWVCHSGCAAGPSWARATLAGVYVYAEAIAFSSDDSLQVVARHAVQNNESLLWLACSSTSDCSADASWAGLDGLWTVNGGLHAELAGTAGGATRIAVYGDDPTTAAVENVFAYLSCDSGCGTASNWAQPLLPPIAAGAADLGFGLAVDGGGTVTIATLSDTGSATTRCASGCSSTSGLWTASAGPSVSDLDGALPPTVPAGCTSASWGMYVGPSLALDPASGAPVMAMTAQATAFGGSCGTGSLATTTRSFLYEP